MLGVEGLRGVEVLMGILRMLLTVLSRLSLAKDLERAYGAGLVLVVCWGCLRFWALFVCCSSVLTIQFTALLDQYIYLSTTSQTQPIDSLQINKALPVPTS
jgi:hypothetical protein